MIMLTRPQVEALAEAIDLAQQWVDERRRTSVYNTPTVEQQLKRACDKDDATIAEARKVLGLVVLDQRAA